MQDLAPIMQVFMFPEDYLYQPISNTQEASILDHQGREVAINQLPSLQPSMWALDPHLIQALSSWASKHNLTLTPPLVDPIYLALSHRESAYHLLRYLLEFFPSDLISEDLLPLWWHPAESEYDDRSSMLNKLQALSHKGHEHSLIIKRPFTSSGRGVYSLHAPIEAEQIDTLYKQAMKHGISIEPKLHRQQDYALLLEVKTQEVCILGYSKFDTDDYRGTSYTGNQLISQELIKSELIKAWGGDAPAWQRLEDACCSYFSELLIGKYEGYIGIDMFTYLDNKNKLRLNPVVEINMRTTMGVLAYKLYERYIAPTSRGLYQLKHFTSPSDLITFDHTMSAQYPQQLDPNKKIIQGYRPLNDPSSAKHFLAYILVKS